MTLRVSAIVHATEDSTKVNQAMRNISRANGTAEPAANRAKGHHGNQITTLVLTIKSSRVAENCVRDLWSRLSTLDKETILSSLASRVGTSGILYLRIDKQQAFKEKIRLQDSDPIRLSISFKFRAKPDGVVNDIQEFLTEVLGSVDENRENHTLLSRPTGHVTGE